MTGVSDNAVGKLENKFKYNGIEFDSTFAVDEYVAHFRNLDPQTGKWWQIDPESENERGSLSPYSSMSDDPILRSDPMGDEDELCCKGIIEKIKQLASDIKEYAGKKLIKMGILRLFYRR